MLCSCVVYSLYAHGMYSGESGTGDICVARPPEQKTCQEVVSQGLVRAALRVAAGGTMRSGGATRWGR